MVRQVHTCAHVCMHNIIQGSTVHARVPKCAPADPAAPMAQVVSAVTKMNMATKRSSDGSGAATPPPLPTLLPQSNFGAAHSPAPSYNGGAAPHGYGVTSPMGTPGQGRRRAEMPMMME